MFKVATSTQQAWSVPQAMFKVFDPAVSLISNKFGG